MTGAIPGVSHKYRFVRIIIHVCLIKQPNGTLSRMYVQTYIRVAVKSGMNFVWIGFLLLACCIVTIVLLEQPKEKNVLKIKTRNNIMIIKYWKLSIGMCQSSSVNDAFYESDGI